MKVGDIVKREGSGWTATVTHVTHKDKKFPPLIKITNCSKSGVSIGGWWSSNAFESS